MNTSSQVPLIEVDKARVLVRVGSSIISDLTPTQFNILELIVGARGVVVSRDRLQKVFRNRCDMRTVDQHVSRLRVRLRRVCRRDIIRTVALRGYALAPGAF